MDDTIQQHRIRRRSGQRIPLQAQLQITTLDGKPIAPLSCCRNIGLGGLSGTAAEGIPPGTAVQIALRLPSGRTFQARGRVAWSMTTLRPSLLSTPRGTNDDARFGIAFDDALTQSLLPIAQLLVARDAERQRANRIRRLRLLPIHA